MKLQQWRVRVFALAWVSSFSTLPAATTDLPEVVVTANRTATETSKATSSMTVIHRETIEANKYQTVKEALHSVPGLALARNGARGQATGVFLRGTNTNHTVILVDGRRLPSDLAGAYDLGNLALDNVERIEVVRGAAASLYGGNTIGGVINLITRDGRGLEKPITSIEEEAGTFKTFRETVSSRGAFGLFDYSIESTRLDTDHERDNNEYRWSNLQSKFGYQVVPELYLDASARYSLADASTPGAIRGFGSPTLYDNALSESWSVSPGATWKTTEAWTQKLFYSHNQRRQVDQSRAFTTATRTQLDSTQLDYQSNIQIAQPWLVTVGGTLDQSKVFQHDDLAGRVTYRNAQTNSGGWVQSQWEILENWNFNGSVRIDHYSDYGNPVTYKFGTAYQIPVTETLLRANYGNAYAPPSEQNFMTFGGFQVVNPGLQPEESIGWDVGVEQPLWKKKLTLSTGYFRNDISGIIQTVTVVPNVSSTSVNGGQAVTEGAEIGLTVAPFDWIDFRSDYTYLTAYNVQSQLRLVRRPRHSWSNELTVRPIKQVSVSLGSRYVLDREDTDAVRSVRTDGENYFVMRAAVVWDATSHLQFFARLENLTDEQYEEVNGFPALDRALYGGVKATF